MISGKYFIQNNNTRLAKEFTNPFKIDSLNIYEVIRIDGGIPLFLDDHIIRFHNSLRVTEKKLLLAYYNIVEQVSELIKINKIENGLIRIVFSFNQENSITLTTFQTIVTFPPPQYYREGISCLLQYSERDNPSAKIFNHIVRSKANNMISSHNIYETILVNSESEITEGSRSNLFFVKGETIYTAPNDLVLRGITRQKVINIINSFGITLHLTPVNVNSIDKMDAIFITGTTPKILPVKRIDEVEFNVNNTIVAQLIQAYDTIVDEHKRTHH